MVEISFKRRERGDLEAAQQAIEEALSIYRATLGESHPSTAASLNNLANIQEALAATDGT